MRSRYRHADVVAGTSLVDSVSRDRATAFLWVDGEGDDVRTREHVEVDSASGESGASSESRATDVAFGRRDDGWDRVIVDRVLVDGIDDRVHVRTALGVAGVTKLLGGVDGDDNDRSQDRDDTDHEQKLDEGESSLQRGEGHKRVGRKGMARMKLRVAGSHCTPSPAKSRDSSLSSNKFRLTSFLRIVKNSRHIAHIF